MQHHVSLRTRRLKKARGTGAGVGEHGIALFLSAVIGSLILTIGLGIGRLAVKQVRLSTVERDSQLAFYAADSGIECALYWDRRDPSVFATSTASPSPTALTCNSQAVTLSPDSVNTTAAITTFRLNTISPSCVWVLVSKSDPDGDHISTVSIEARGRSECSGTEKLIRVERAIRVQY